MSPFTFIETCYSPNYGLLVKVLFLKKVWILLLLGRVVNLGPVGCYVPIYCIIADFLPFVQLLREGTEVFSSNCNFVYFSSWFYQSLLHVFQTCLTRFTNVSDCYVLVTY